MRWFKLHSEIKDDPKMLEMDDHQRWLWICLLAMASESKDIRGVISDVRIRGLAASLRTDEVRLCETLRLWSDLSMIAYNEDERTITVLHWDARQYENPSDKPEATRLRKQKSRLSHDMSRLSHETDPETDPDSESDTELQIGAGDLTPVVSQNDLKTERTEADLTKSIVAKMESVGIGVSPYTVDTYIAAASDYGIHAVLSGISSAADNNNQHKVNYVLACIRNKAQGIEPQPPTNGKRNGQSSGNGKTTNLDRTTQAIDDFKGMLRKEGLI